MRLLLALFPALLAADWLKFHSGPFEVYTDAGARPARETLARFEQFRWALGQAMGQEDLATPVPIRILIFERKPAYAAERVLEGRDRRAIALARNQVPGSAFWRELAVALLEANTARMPEPIERGLADLFSTLQVEGLKVMLGAPPPKPDPDWARLHLLATSPDYYGRLRTLLSNLSKGVPEDVAYRNSLNKTREEIDQEVQAHLKAGKFETVRVAARPLNPERDFHERALEPAGARLAVADLLLDPAPYEALLRDQVYPAEAHEGLGLMALRANDRDAARRHLAAASEAGSKSPRTYLEAGRLEAENSKAIGLFERAVKINPKLAEPHFAAAERENDPKRRLARLKTAAQLAPRRADYWQALAEAALAANEYGEAARAWRAAEQAATNEGQRARYRQARGAVEEQRLNWEAAERRREAEEKERELRKLKEEALAEVRALEARINRGVQPSTDKPVPWWEGPKVSGRLTGVLKQVDCLGKQARLVVAASDGKLTRLLVTDPSAIALIGSGEVTLGCGPQKNRRLIVEYVPKPNARLNTAGEVTLIEFQ